ncbi:MAG: hypothetical protein BWX47_01963 [candidate division Hyd24-12 bacterium ADurb.Bin004]|nr:MAG: hypothetical protein BWX47_01963 [candidate division Hyd24-12 bacterium ADurb.Bin004]
MQHEALGVLAGYGVYPLFVAVSAQSGGHERLCLTSGEHRRSVGAGDDSDLAFDVADLVGCAPVETHLVHGQPLADVGLLDLLHDAAE